MIRQRSRLLQLRNEHYGLQYLRVIEELWQDFSVAQAWRADLGFRRDVSLSTHNGSLVVYYHGVER